MLDAPVRRALEKKMWKAQLLFVALVSSVLVYCLICYILTVQGKEPGSEHPPDTLVRVLGVTALVTLITSFVMRAYLLRNALAKLPATLDESHADAVMRAALTPWIAGWSLCEAVTIYGLVLFVLTMRWDFFLPFWGVGLVALATQAPTLRSLEQALDRR